MSTTSETEEPSQAAAPIAALRFHLWAWSAPFGLPFLQGLMFLSMPLVVLVTTGIVLFALVLIAVFVIVIVLNAKKRRWWRALSASLAMIYLIAEPFSSIPLAGPFYTAGLWVGLLPFYPHYEAQVAALPPHQGPGFLVVNLGEAGFWAHALIYDESDRLPLTPGFGGLPDGWNKAWGIETCSSLIRLPKHFYACFIYDGEI